MELTQTASNVNILIHISTTGSKTDNKATV